MLDQGRGHPLAKDNAKGVTHPQECGSHGPLTVRKPVLRDLGWDSGDEGTGHSGDALAYHGHPVLGVF